MRRPPKVLPWTLLALASATKLTPAIHMRIDAGCKQKQSMYNVYLYDDHFNMREYVSRVLMMVCKLSESQASQVMMEAHWEYRALIGTWEKPVADHICEGLSQKGLSAETCPVEDMGGLVEVPPA